MADKTVRLVSGEDVLYPKTLVTNILNEDGTQWKPSSGGGSGVETLVLNEADWMTIVDLTDLNSDIPTKGRVTGRYEMKPYGLIQCTVEGMTVTFQVSSGITMAPMATGLCLISCENDSLMFIALSYSAMGGSSSSDWSYNRKVYALTSAS